MSVPPPPSAVVDTECYIDYWCARFSTGESFELYAGHPLDREALANALRRYLIITFNGNNYDVPLIVRALEGASNAELKAASDAIIVHGIKSWDIARPPDWLNHIDLFDVAPGQGSLKSYGARMHTRKLQDLPYQPSDSIDALKRPRLFEYCGNDLTVTGELAEAMATQLALRADMSAEYGVDLRSKSDAQIAEAVMRKVLPFRVEKPNIPYGAAFFYRPPAWIEFAKLDVLRILARCPFQIAASGAPQMSDELAATRVRIGDMAYQMGSGGLHSTESKRTVVADDVCTLLDVDVASYYPSLILKTGIYPPQIGPIFLDIYRGWYESRLRSKAKATELKRELKALKKHSADPLCIAQVELEIEKHTKDANSKKTNLNGCFGKLGSPWSIFYVPSELIQVTVTGQLALLMLIEKLEQCGIPVISANTDGIVIKCPNHLHWLRDECVRSWETQTGMVTEANEYRLLASRDVNSYVAIKPGGEVKTKGAFAPPEPGASGWPNPTGQISVDAAVAWLRDGVPPEVTVRACADVRQFVHVRQVKGGGSYCPRVNLPKRTTLKAMRAVCGNLPKELLLPAYELALSANAAEREYLGKTVRWYYAVGSAGCIVTPSGGLVARTDGCRPLMELPDTLPCDIDHDWYIEEAYDLLVDMGAY